MRLVIILFFWLSVSVAKAGEYTVFEKEGFYGIKDENGEISVPPVYEYLGWSDESYGISSGVIGYREGNLWGLITAKNKVILEPRYHSISPFEKGLFKASLKGKFSNRLFHGILNQQGKTLVSFAYFSIEKLAGHLLVGIYENNEQLFGLISNKNEILIPINYKRIQWNGKFLLAKNTRNTNDIYLQNGYLVVTSVDSMRETEKGLVAFKNGFAGFIDWNGDITYDFAYKDIQLEEGILFPISFPRWAIYEDKSLLFEIKADSIARDKRGFWQAYLNGAHRLALLDSSLNIQDELLMDVTDYHYLLKDKSAEKWCAIDKNGDKVLQNYDSIYGTNYALWGKQKGVWKLFNRYGKRKDRFSYEVIYQGVDGQFIGRLNEHWGIINAYGVHLGSFKYDSIVLFNNVYQVKYLDRWGVLNTDGNWLLNTDFDDVSIYENMYVGKKAYAYTYVSKDGWSKTSIFKPRGSLKDYFLIQNDNQKFGLLYQNANLFIYPKYDSIVQWNDFLEFQLGDSVSLNTSGGYTIVDFDEGLQLIRGFNESYFLIQKNDKWGFLDSQGRLRISNRYDDARLFSEGLAAIKLRGKWGFINKDESLVIQPFYNEVSDFKNGLSIVSIDDQFGLINPIGEEIVSPSWKEIKRLPSGNYLVRDTRNKVGLISPSGSFLLRPSFDELEDKSGKVIVSQENRKGVLDYMGNQLFKTAFKEIKISDDFTILKH